jgi:very-short-patch-repair endonuclease
LKADFLWRRQRLIVELDGWAAHGTRNRFESDRQRDQRSRRAGLDPLRFTHRQVVRDPGWVAETTVAMLAR